MRPLLTSAVLLVACNGKIGPGPDPTIDSDGDGLSDYAETVGWTSTIDSTGASAPSALEVRDVSSDPNNPDTDGDGLNDAEEFAALTDPESVDTDGDGLSDRDEVRRWHTSPLNADTDGDGLLDGAELALVDDAPGPNATAPWLADTDGDGMSDGEERNDTARDPLIAELPWLALTVDRLSVDITVDAFFQGAPSVETITGNMDGDGALSLAVASEDLGGLAGTATHHILANAADTSAIQATHTAAQTLLRSRTDPTVTARVAVEVSIVHDGSASAWRTQSPAFTLAGLDEPLVLTAPVDVDVAPGETVVVSASVDADPEVAQGLLADPSQLTVTWTDAAQLWLDDGNAFDRLALVNGRTARIGMDVGDGEPLIRHVVVGLDRTPDGVPVAEPLHVVLSRLGLDLLQADDGAIIDLDGHRAALHDGDAPDLNDPDHLPTEQPGPRLVAAWWEGVVDDVLPGDAVALRFLQDADRDGLDDAFEAQHGATDTLVESDADGLSDWFETQIGWEVAMLTRDGAVFKRVYPSPALDDTDGDGISDYDEYWDGTDPRAADTDGDNSPDSVDVLPLAYNAAGPDLDGLTVSQPQLGGTWTVAGVVVDEQDDMVELRIDWGDGTEYIQYTGFDAVHVTHPYAVAGPYTITVTAIDAVGQTTVRSQTVAAYVIAPDHAYANDCGNPAGAGHGGWCGTAGFDTGVGEIGTSSTFAGWFEFGAHLGDPNVWWNWDWLWRGADRWLLGEIGYPALFMKECNATDCLHPVSLGFRGDAVFPRLNLVNTDPLPRDVWFYIAGTIEDLGDNTSRMTIWWGEEPPLQMRTLVVDGVDLTWDNCRVTAWDYTPQSSSDVASGNQRCDTQYIGGRPAIGTPPAGPEMDNLRIYHRALNEYEITALMLQ